MEVYDINGNLLEKYDLSAGRLEPSNRIEHHDAIPAVEEVFRWDEKHYPNGGISRRKIIEQEATPEIPAWDEEIQTYVYIPYTQEELDKIEEEKNKPTQEQRLQIVEDALNAIFGGIADTQI